MTDRRYRIFGGHDIAQGPNSCDFSIARLADLMLDIQIGTFIYLKSFRGED